MKSRIRNMARGAAVVAVLTMLTACGGGDSGPAAQVTPPPPATYTVGGTVKGLSGSGLVLQNEGGADLPISASGGFVFATRMINGTNYSVTVKTPPTSPLQYCQVANASGIIAAASVTNVSVTCGNGYWIGGTVSGLVGKGLKLMLFDQNDCCNWYSALDEVAISANEAFVFPLTLLDANVHGYGVSVDSEPTSPRQPCVVRNTPFTIAAASVTDVAVFCAEFAYLVNSTDNTISAFSVDATTGAIASAGPPVTAGMSPSAIVSTSDKKYLYVVNSDSNDVSVFAVDPNSGALTTSPGSPVVAGTKPRALSLYSAVSRHSGYGGNSSHRDSYLYVANAGSDDLSVYGVDQSTGVLTPLSPASYATGTGPSAIAIDHSITSNPSPSFLFTANTGGSGDISAFQINTRSGALTPIAGSPFPSGSSVSSLAVGSSNPPGEGFLYAANASGSAAAIYGYSVDPNGVLTSLAGFPFPLPSCNYIVADQTGTYLYAAVGTNIIGYIIDRARDTGALSALAGFPIAVGGNVQSVSIDPTNQFLYVGNGGAGTVTGFKLNEATGGLTPMPGSPFPVGKPPHFFATF